MKRQKSIVNGTEYTLLTDASEAVTRSIVKLIFQSGDCQVIMMFADDTIMAINSDVDVMLADHLSVHDEESLGIVSSQQRVDWVKKTRAEALAHNAAGRKAQFLKLKAEFEPEVKAPKPYRPRPLGSE